MSQEYESKLQLQKAYKQFFSDWDFDLHLTMTFDKAVSISSAIAHAKKYFKKIKNHYPKLLFAGLILAVKKDYHLNPHLHILLVSQKTNQLNTLLDIPKDDLILLFDGNLKITRSDEATSKTLSAYLAKKKNLDLDRPDSFFLDFYRPKLLLKIKEQEAAKFSLKS